MAEEREESPQETPHFTTDDASDAGPDTPSVAPDDVKAHSEESSDPEERPQDGDFGSDDAITKTAIDDAKNA
jgi:hypothetical protein